MFGFFFKLILAVALFFVGRYLLRYAKAEEGRRPQGLDPKLARTLAKIARVAGIFFLLYAFVGTSVVWVPSGQFATLKRVYAGNALQPGRIVALDGELGPQARVITAGFRFSPCITLLNEVEYVDVFTVPNGKCALMSAKDGIPIRGGNAFAAPWSDDTKHLMANDAAYFLTHGGERGPQVTTLLPGSYTINPFLWESPELIDAKRVEQGFVGVVKSSVRAAVDFGPFRRQLPETDAPKILTRDKLPKDAAGARLVAVGAIGVWEEPLPNGLYYINTNAYKITMVPTVAQVEEYKGGYKRRIVEVEVNDKGQITQRVSEVEVQEVPEAADKAIFTKPEGWDVAQELRVLVQVSPELAPFVVASLGLTEENASEVIENRVVTPIMRSVVRDVEGGAHIHIKYQKAVLDEHGNPVIGSDGMPKIEVAHEFRAVKVFDLLENRASLEEAIEEEARPETLKEGVTLLEVRLAESSIPAELLIARKREQLAQQLTKAWAQEEIAQTQRQKTENARSQADQQSELVKAEIAARAATERAAARVTEGNGEKTYLIAIAEGQKAQSEILGPEATMRLQMFQQGLKAVEGLVERNPDLLSAAITNASKFVPNVVVNSNGTSSLEGAAAIFGNMLRPELALASKNTTPAGH